MLRLAVLLVVLATSPAIADTEENHDRARRAFQAGEIVPLDEIINDLRRQGFGAVLEVELKRRNGRWVYEIETLSEDGLISKTRVDATTREQLPRRDRHDDED
mgnify:CR=1 FL=1